MRLKIQKSILKLKRKDPPISLEDLKADLKASGLSGITARLYAKKNGLEPAAVSRALAQLFSQDKRQGSIKHEWVPCSGDYAIQQGRYWYSISDEVVDDC